MTNKRPLARQLLEWLIVYFTLTVLGDLQNGELFSLQQTFQFWFGFHFLRQPLTLTLFQGKMIFLKPLWDTVSHQDLFILEDRSMREKRQRGSLRRDGAEGQAQATGRASWDWEVKVLRLFFFVSLYV